MICYRCGSTLTGEDFCNSCGVDVKIYRKIIHLSNRYYNEGLERASIRDLSGAEESLRKSLKYYKLNMQARNLLGLVYFEMGETVGALSEWVISRSLIQDKNPAERYLSSVQSNKNKLEALNQTIKKYNQALLYCKQGSKDLAIIQLKKVLTLNPKLVKGHQLLALLHLEDKNYNLAEKSLQNAKKIDAGNTTTQRYLKEVNKSDLEGTFSQSGKRKEKEDVVSYRSGNETIITPTGFKDYSAVSTIINIVIGIALGVLVTSFLIVPNIRRNAEQEAKKSVQEASEAVNTKTQTVKNLETQVEDLQQELEKMKVSSTDNQNTISMYESLLAACEVFLVQADMDSVATALESIKPESLSTKAKAVYDVLSNKSDTQYAQEKYPEGEAAYQRRDFETAAEILQRVVDYEETYKEGYAIYYLAQSYRNLEDNDNAKKYYQRVVELYPGSQRARTSQNYINEIEASSANQ